MPVFATPNGNPGQCDAPQLPGTKEPPTVITPTSPTCLNQHVIVPREPREATTGAVILNRTRAYDVKGGQDACLEHVMRDTNGNPVDLSECLGLPSDTIIDVPPLAPGAHCFNDPVQSSSSIPQSSQSSQPSESMSSQSQSSQSMSSSSMAACATKKVTFTLSEYLTGCGAEFDATVKDATNGVVEVCLPKEAVNCPGIYFGAFAVVNQEEGPNNSGECCDNVIFSNHVYVNIGRNLFAQRLCCSTALGPPSIAEIRLFLRDTGGEESFLLDNLAYSDEEILHAMSLPVQMWNEIPPPIHTYSTQNFPFRYHWLIATTGYLFMAAAEQYRRNNLTYSAGGVQVNDQDKEPNYEQAAHRRLEEYREFVRRKKASMNLEMGYGGVGSTYARHGSGFRGPGNQPYRIWYEYY